jgi:predicted nucleic acid-binding protein
VDTQIQLLYDPGLDDIRKEVFCHWLLDSIASQSRSGQEVPLGQIEADFTDRLGFEIWKSRRTRIAFEESIAHALKEKWIEATPAVQFRENAYRLTALGDKRLKRVEEQRSRLLEDCYADFALLVYAGLGKDAGAGGIARDAVIPVVEEAYRQAIGSADGDLKGRFTEYWRRVSPNLSVRLFLAPLAKSLREDMPPDCATDVQTTFGLGDTRSPEAARLVRALERACGFIHRGGLEMTPHLQHWLLQRAYEHLFRRVWPYDQELQERLSRNLSCIFVYPDTNVIIAALARSDPLHGRAQRILRFLFENDINVIWTKDTEVELKGHLELARQLVVYLQSMPDPDVHAVIQAANVPSFVASYFRESWRSWHQFEQEIWARYRRLADRAAKGREALESLGKDARFAQTRDAYAAWFLDQLQIMLSDRSGKLTRHMALVRHDAMALATVAALRRMLPNTLVQQPCKHALKTETLSLAHLFWLVTFDRKLWDLDTRLEELRDDPLLAEAGTPFCLMFESILLFLDPYLVSKALMESQRKPRLGPVMSLRGPEDIREIVRSAAENMAQTKLVTAFIREFNWDEVRKYEPYEVHS